VTGKLPLHRGAPLPARVTRVAAFTALYSALAGWGALTVLRNLDQSQGLLYRVTRLGLTVPNYRFFGPTPATHDLALLIRQRHRDGSLTEWDQVVVTEERSALHTLWAPFRRAEKAVSDSIREIYRVGVDVVSAEFLPKAMGYKMLLHVARRHAPKDSGAVDIQFAVCQLAAYEPDVIPQVTYISEFHDLATGEIALKHIPRTELATEEAS
jgi:hypothetical protein